MHHLSLFIILLTYKISLKYLNCVHKTRLCNHFYIHVKHFYCLLWLTLADCHVHTQLLPHSPYSTQSVGEKTG